MNIFVSSYSPCFSAMALDDLRLNKMCIETAQLVSTAVHHGVVEAHGEIYKPAYVHHPVTKWVCSSKTNAIWSALHLHHLLLEYKNRFGRVHGSSKVWVSLALPDPSDNPPMYNIAPDTFCNCTPYPELEVTEAYRKTLNDKWRADIRPPRWTNASPPLWRD